MDELRVHNILTFYLPLLILTSFMYEFLNKNSRALIYVVGYLIAYLAIRLEIHHYTHKWSAHRDPEVIKILLIYNLLAVGFLLPTLLAYSTKATLIRNIMIYIIVVLVLYVPISKMIVRLLGRGLFILSFGSSLVIFIITQNILEPTIFALLSLWTYLVLKHDLVAYTQERSVS
ncbi:hypothetical protein GQS_06655 [Thermococcus sp. 4557]|uniref:hypothetical protein n=1 Tax=Thermococcus sp. (strain CGMCC 1.5172 / 4557) TaxID=1042877 RepID=UPI000219E90E|nr:hypothetical protein [Thermococcus sp. 4557]AEK73229.1 hypothetical protein GQS_06655 [Thermococcus sp. 4557]